MNIDAEKLKLVQMIVDIKSEETIARIKNFVKKEQTDFWDELDEVVKADVEEAIKQADAGMGIPHEEVAKEYSKWLKQ
jgi:predicted transcriptional regulator